MSRTLVIGGTGKTGRRVVRRLTALGHPVRVGSRSGRPPFDWTDRSTWPAALDGCDAAYVSYQPDLALPGAADTVGALARAAVAAGTSRLVFLSGRGEDESARCEAAVQTSGADWTVIRSAFFAQNFSEHLFADTILNGELAMVPDGAGEPFVDADDIAEIATVALTRDGHAGRLYEVTGPELVTFADAVAQIGAATGRRVEYREVAPAEFARGLQALGLPAEDADGFAYLFAELLDGRNAHLTDGVQQALGRPAGSFAAYVQRDWATAAA